MSKHLFRRELKVDDTEDFCPLDGKVSYLTSADVMRNNGRNVGSPYKCRHCGAWHFTTKEAKIHDDSFLENQELRRMRIKLGYSMSKISGACGLKVEMIRDIEIAAPGSYTLSQKEKYVKWLKEQL